MDVPANEERFKLLVESVTDYAIFLLDPQGYIQSWNPGAQRFKGYTAEEAIGKHFSIFYTEQDLEKKHPDYELDIARKEGRFEEESWRVRKDGTRFWANVVITRLVNSDGVFVGFAKVTRDLTQRKKSEERLRLSEERYRLLVSAVKDYAIFMIDTQGHIATWNEGAQRLKGYSAQEIIGQNFSKFYTQEDVHSRKPEWELEEATLTGRFEDEGWRVRKDGTRFWANVILSAIRNEEGTLIGFSKVTRDMTDRRRSEENLKRVNEELDARVKERTAQLEEAIRARDEFMSIASHELRTPITSLKLQVQAMARQMKIKMNGNDFQILHQRTEKFIKATVRQLDRLGKLIDDMLDVSRISMERLSLEIEELDLTEVVRECVEQFREESKSVGSEMSFQSAGVVKIRGDRHRLEQVFSNLIMNALKYGNGKPVFISIGSTHTRAWVEIQDQGLGIAPEDQSRIFERFERAISGHSIRGMGLGLFISRKIVDLHKGEISVRSELGKGSVFTVVLPAI